MASIKEEAWFFVGICMLAWRQMILVALLGFFVGLCF